MGLAGMAKVPAHAGAPPRPPEGGGPEQEAASAWLAGDRFRLDLVFPPVLEALFTADTEAARLRALRVVNGAGCAVSIAIVPVIWMVLPDARGAIERQFVGGVIPMALLYAVLVRTRLSLAVKEWLQISMAVAMGLLIGSVLRMSRHSPESYFFGSLMLLGVLSAIGGRVSFRATSVLMAGLTAVFDAMIWAMPGVPVESGVGLSLMWTFSAFYVLYGNWQYEAELRRGYALALLERRARDDLAGANRELARLAERDALTDLANRRSYEAWLSLHWGRAAADGGRIGLIVADIDRFKLYNDHYGHAGGDACLRAVAACLRDGLRGTSDHLARLGGEEFVILLPGLPLEACGDVAERIRRCVEAMALPHAGAGPGTIVTISCGAASLQVTPETSPATLFDLADAALYRAKEGGRNRVCLGEAAPAASPEGSRGDRASPLRTPP